MTLRWWPRRLASQLLAALLGGLLLSHAAGLAVLSRERGDMHPLARDKALDLYVRLFRSVETLDADLARSALLRASDEQAVFSLVDVPVGHAPTTGSSGNDAPAEDGVAAVDADAERAEQSAATAGRLAQRLSRPVEQIRACVGEGCVAMRGEQGERGARESGADARPAQPMLLQAQRPDGRWLRATIWTDVRTRWWWPVSFWLQASLLPVFIAVALVAGGVLRPGRALVSAAGRISRGQKVEPLKVEGPQEVREVLQAFNQMQQRISRFLDDRMRMLASISHDFRTPITSLRLRAEMVDDPELREPMVRTLAEMRAMVEETLRFTRDETMEEPSIDTSLKDLLDEVIDDQRALGRDVGWADPPAVIEAYRCRPVTLKRAFANLIDNAVRYGARARIRLEEDAAALRIDIDDDGPGIPARWHDTAFTPFSPMPEGTAAQRAGGAGLGLSIARTCARAHGGDVLLLGRPTGSGLRARVVLPV